MLIGCEGEEGAEQGADTEMVWPPLVRFSAFIWNGSSFGTCMAVPPTPAALAAADAEALRTSRYCISAAAALEYDRDLPSGGGWPDRERVEAGPSGVSVERVRYG